MKRPLTDDEIDKLLQGVLSDEDENEMNKVHGGTPKGSGTICTTCRRAMVMKGINFEQKIYCAMLGSDENGDRGLVKFPVAECSAYDDRRQPALHEMRQIAWVIRSRNRGPVGFTDGQKKMDVSIDPPQRHPWQVPDDGAADE